MKPPSKDVRRRSVFQAAQRVFAREGFQFATMDAVCREAELSKGGIYRYVSSKDELFLQVAIDAYGALSDDIRALGDLERSCAAYDELRNYVAALLNFACVHTEAMRVLVQGEEVEGMIAPESPLLGEYRRARDSLRMLVVVALNRGRLDGSIRSDISPEHMAATLRGALRGLLGMDATTERVEAGTLAGATANDCVDMVMRMMRPNDAG